MGSFGERLRREREMRGVTLDEISVSTKIARRHLEALETENFDSLPGGIFNRGFVRAYAKFLGIDEEQAVADYVSASGEQSRPEPNFAQQIAAATSEPQLNPRRSSLPLILALLALVVVLAIFWARNKRQAEPNENPAASTPTSVSPAATPSPAATISPVAIASTEPSSIHGAAPSSGATASPTASSSNVPADRSKGESVPAQSSSPARTFLVKVEAKEDAWITATADGKTIVSGKTLRAGDQQLVRAGKKIVLITGNAGGLDVSFNGKLLGPIGSESERRELTFTPSGLVQ